MRISFIGQLGFPKLLDHQSDSPESRVKNLSAIYAFQNHKVTVYGTKPYLKTGSFKGINLVQIASLDPQRPGGFVYNFLSVLRLIISDRPDVVHINNWTAARILGAAKWLLPRTLVVVTASKTPYSLLLIPRSFLITAPTRSLQYQLLNKLGLRASYIPDGFQHGTWSKENGKRVVAGDYLLLLGQDTKAIKLFAEAHRASKAKTKLVIAGEETPALKRLAKKFRGIKIVGTVGSRTLQQLLASSSGILLVDGNVPSSTVLQSMSLAKPIISVLANNYQELLGVTGRFVTQKDKADIAAAINEIATSSAPAIKRAKAAKTRAKRHFTWTRISSDYATLYHTFDAKRVPLDSARAVKFIKVAA